MGYMGKLQFHIVLILLSSPGRSPGRAVVLPPALALASALALAKC